MKISEMLNAVQAINDINNQELSFKLSLKFHKVISQCDNVLKLFNTRRTNIIKELSSDGQQVDPSKKEEFENKIQELLDTEVDEKLTPVPLSELENEQGFKIKPATIALLLQLGIVTE